MFDFGSEIRNEGGEKGRNQKGLVTIDRKLKKDSFYLCKAYWSKENFVKLAGSRFVNRHEEMNDIVVLSNIKHIKLYVNNEFVSEINSSESMKKFESVKLTLGENKIKVEAFDEDGNTYIDEMILKHVKEADESYVLKNQKNKHMLLTGSKSLIYQMYKKWQLKRDIIQPLIKLKNFIRMKRQKLYLLNILEI